MVGLSVSVNAQQKGKVTYYGNVWIKNSVQLTPETTLFYSVGGDGQKSVTTDPTVNLYKDYRLLNGDPCVSAGGSPGFLFYPQRTADCTPNTRHFRVYLPQQALESQTFLSVCSNFIQSDGRNFVTAWRMYTPNLYGTTDRKTKTILTDVRFGFWCGSNAYMIKTDAPLQPEILSADGATRRLLNKRIVDGGITASLGYPTNGEFTSIGVNNFEFPFDITTQQATQ
jgi:hypothetical protein